MCRRRRHVCSCTPLLALLAAVLALIAAVLIKEVALLALRALLSRLAVVGVVAEHSPAEVPRRAAHDDPRLEVRPLNEADERVPGEET